jgi:hypothetical protein
MMAVIYHNEDADPEAIRGETIAILGYGRSPHRFPRAQRCRALLPSRTSRHGADPEALLDRCARYQPPRLDKWIDRGSS